MAKSIFGITAEYFQTMSDLEDYFNENPDAAGDIPDEFLERLNINKDEMETKLYHYNLAIEHLDGEMSMYDQRIKKLQILKNTKGNIIKRLKNLQLEAVHNYGTLNKSGKSQVVKTEFVNLQVRKLKKLEIQEELVPKKYVNTTIAFKGERTDVEDLFTRVISAVFQTDALLADELKTTITVMKKTHTTNTTKLKKDLKDEELAKELAKFAKLVDNPTLFNL